jgi:hypothetical protein
VPRRQVIRNSWSPIVLVVALATACAGPAGDRAAPPPPPTAAATTLPPTTTTTTLPVPADVADLIATTTMTERGRRLFLATAPAVEDLATFVRNCGVEPAPESASQGRTHTQGCFVNGHIHLLSPDRAEAHDLLYVVAAHELLHAVYASLGPAERARIDAEVEAARAGNDRLEERLKPYGSTPTLDNEMHSILGSEFDGLSPALEAHFAQFFANRATLVADRQRTLGAREDEMKRMKADIDALEARIEALKDTQEALRSANDIRTYNANVPVINGLIGRYNAQVDVLNARVDEYNSLLGA